jgi:hypothetical protein
MAFPGSLRLRRRWRTLPGLQQSMPLIRRSVRDALRSFAPKPTKPPSNSSNRVATRGLVERRPNGEEENPYLRKGFFCHDLAVGTLDPKACCLSKIYDFWSPR